jgi:hypothetical protein
MGGQGNAEQRTIGAQHYARVKQTSCKLKLQGLKPLVSPEPCILHLEVRADGDAGVFQKTFMPLSLRAPMLPNRGLHA